MQGTFHSSAPKMLLVCMVAVFFFAICFINLCAVPSFYDGDMYCDYRYAMEAWKHKSLFPDGWVFGNQLNAVSTPVLAALIYGFSGNMNFSMGLACSVMAVQVVLCYDWMLQSVLKDTESRLLAVVLFLAVSLYCGKAVEGNQGWTLLFTMCSYYAGYSITAFLAFGCYLHSLSGSTKRQGILLIPVCIFSFGTGIQSIRQTAIMVAPILGVEFLRLLLSFRNWKEHPRPLWTALAISVSNFLGLCYVRMRDINQNAIFGEITFTSPAELKQACMDCIFMVKDLLGADHPESLLVIALLGLLCLVSLVMILRSWLKEKHFPVAALTLLILASVAVIVVIDVLTTMFIRPRYYFMVYPLIGFLVAYLHEVLDSRKRWWLLVLAIGFFCTSGVRELAGVCATAANRKEDVSYVISDHLLKNGYETVYAAWNQGENVAIASNGALTVGYWHQDRLFEKVTYLCNLDVYDTAPEKCAYFFEGKDAEDLAISAARARGIDLEMVWCDAQKDTYLYTAAVNLLS